MRTRFQALLIAVAASAAVAVSLVVLLAGGKQARPKGLPSPAQKATLAGRAARVARESDDARASGVVVGTNQSKLFKFNHGSGGNSGKDIYLVVLRGHFRTSVGIPGRARPESAIGRQITLQYAARDLSEMGFAIGAETPGLLKLGPSEPLELR
jgi:hypothetical protein